MFTVSDPMDAPPLRWGVLGAGGIAGTFVRAVRDHTAGEVVAIGSRAPERAGALAAAHGLDARAVRDGYEALVGDDAVDAVYVATPHSHHREHALLAIAAGRAVLVEKAFTRDAAQAREVLAAAAAAGVFAMEAMWTKHLPHARAIRELVAGGAIGEVVHLAADHGQDLVGLGPDSRLLNPDLAGGALLDLGVYPLSFAHALLGAPSQVVATGSLTATGVDATVSLALAWAGGARATVHTTLMARTATTASIAGSAGRIDVEGDFYAPTSFTLTRDDGTSLRYGRPVDGGFQFQVAEVARCVAAGATASEVMSPSDTVEVMEVLDAARAQVGVVYPGEQ